MLYCAVYTGPRFDRGDWDSDANICSCPQLIAKVFTHMRSGLVDIMYLFVDLTENDCPSTTGPLISSPGSAGDGSGVTWMVRHVCFRPQTSTSNL